MQEVLVRDLGTMDYRSAWDMQETLLQDNISIKKQARETMAADLPSLAANELNTATRNREAADALQWPTRNYLLLLEHPPVYTLGKSGKMENLLISEQEMTDHGIAFFKTNRGGDITFHGPGQLIGYPIIDLENFYTDIGRYLRNLERVVIDTLGDYGIIAGRSPGETGVWLEPETTGRARKICAMGVRCSRWITMHGLALNVNTDLAYFDHIIPCGIQGKQVTSLQKELGLKVSMQEVKQRMMGHFEEIFRVKMRMDC